MKLGQFRAEPLEICRLKPKREYLLHLWGAAEPLALAPRCFQNGLWILNQFASTLFSGDLLRKQVKQFYTQFIASVSAASAASVLLLIRLKLEETVSFYFCGLVCSKALHHSCLQWELSSHSSFFHSTFTNRRTLTKLSMKLCSHSRH